MKESALKIILGLAIWFAGAAVLQLRAATWDVADYGAQGDAIQTMADTVSNSAVVQLEATNLLSSSDAGKLIELFGAGPVTSGTNHQDLIAEIVSATNGTNVTISVPADLTGTNLNCTFGTQNAGAFQACVNACQGTNAILQIPAGRYLLVPPQVLETNFVMANAGTVCPAISLSKGGITFQGDTAQDTILLGNGAWTLNNGAVQRGVILCCVGPVTNDAPLIFENLTFDGGVQVGNVQNGSGPADPVTGGGWDVTHDAVVDMGEAPLHADKQFINCDFAHWRGEIVKSVVSWNTGFIGVTNCAFWDGDGSAFNFNWTPHVIDNCLFSNLNMAMEYYVGSMAAASTFENSLITNTRIAIVLVGGLTNYPSPGYNILSNTISASQYGVCLGPARNVTIAGNTFTASGAGIATDSYAYQGNDINCNIQVANNLFLNVGFPLSVCGSGADDLKNMTLSTNTAYGCLNFASGYGECSNVVFIGNVSIHPAPSGTGGLNSSQLAGPGQWFEDVSNNFPPYPVNISKAQLTNTISYANGQYQEIESSWPGGVCLLDNSEPAFIPLGASLVVTNGGAFSVTIFPSNSAPVSTALIVPAGSKVSFKK